MRKYAAHPPLPLRTRPGGEDAPRGMSRFLIDKEMGTSLRECHVGVVVMSLLLKKALMPSGTKASPVTQQGSPASRPPARGCDRFRSGFRHAVPPICGTGASSVPRRAASRYAVEDQNFIRATPTPTHQAEAGEGLDHVEVEIAAESGTSVIVQDDRFDRTASVTVCAFTSDPCQGAADPSAGRAWRTKRQKAASRLMVDKITTVPKRANSEPGSGTSPIGTLCGQPRDAHLPRPLGLNGAVAAPRRAAIPLRTHHAARAPRGEPGTFG